MNFQWFEPKSVGGIKQLLEEKEKKSHGLRVGTQQEEALRVLLD